MYITNLPNRENEIGFLAKGKGVHYCRTILLFNLMGLKKFKIPYMLGNRVFAAYETLRMVIVNLYVHACKFWSRISPLVF